MKKNVTKTKSEKIKERNSGVKEEQKRKFLKLFEKKVIEYSCPLCKEKLASLNNLDAHLNNR